MLNNLIPLPTVVAPKLRKPPLALSLYENVKLSENTLVRQVTRQLMGSWRRSVRSIGGYWIGEASYDGPEAEMEEIFRDGLMWEIRETFGGMITWQGFLASIRYTKNGVEYERSWSDIANRIMAKYQEKSYNMIVDGSFEVGIPESYGSPAKLERVTSWKTDGEYSLHIVANSLSDGVYLARNVTIEEGYNYDFSIDTMQDENSDGYFSFYIWRQDTSERWKAGNVYAAGNKTVKFSLTSSETVNCTVDIIMACMRYPGEIWIDAASFVQGSKDAKTGWYEDTKSQGIYGKIEDIVSGREMSDAAAVHFVNTELVKRAYGRIIPPSSLDISRINTEPGSRLDLVFYGYNFTLRNLYSAQNDEEGISGTCTSVINAEVAASEFITPFEIQTNTMEYLSNSVTDRRRQWNILSDIALAGDDNFDRWEIGVLQNRKLYYRKVDQTLKGRIKRGEARDAVGALIDPWMVEPGNYLLEDMLTGGQHVSDNLSDNERVVYIDEVEFDAKGWAEGGSGITFNRTSDLERG